MDNPLCYFLHLSGLWRSDGDPVRHRTLHWVRDAGNKINKKLDRFASNNISEKLARFLKNIITTKGIHHTHDKILLLAILL